MAALAAQMANAFPLLSEMPRPNPSRFSQIKTASNVKRQSACPFNANHQGAAPYNSKYPYTGAKNGLPGTGIGGIKVPADGDTAHAFEPPGPNDIRGPCPGLNAAANHHFLSHDGITTFAELLDMQQNLYNLDYTLAVVLATLGVALDGDVLTGKLSIGCDATSRTSATGNLLGKELGLNGHGVSSVTDMFAQDQVHDSMASHLPKFEQDTSLTRNDFFLASGDDYTFNSTLFASMASTCANRFDRDGLALYRYQRYQSSLANNPNFYFGPKSVLAYGAASFLYELFPSFGPEGTPNLETISSFFGAESDGSGGFRFNNREIIPPNWYNRRLPYNIPDAATEILAQYLKYPVLFGGNAGKGNFDLLQGYKGVFGDGKFTGTAKDVTCLLYQLATDNVPSSLAGVLELPLQVVEFSIGKLNPKDQLHNPIMFSA
ncbi:MAG: hypothetical protein Q9212_000034 [Teloschistes hypoglaucus]